MPIYDSVQPYRVPEWLTDYVYSRNEVTIHPDVLDQVKAIKGNLHHYRNEPEEFLKGIKETLEAEVRSKFQTSKQMEFTEKGQLVAVLFDEAVVRYQWVAERKFEIQQVTLKSMDKTVLEKETILGEDEAEFDETVLILNGDDSGNTSPINV